MLAKPSEKRNDLKLTSATIICGIMTQSKDRAVASVGLPALRIAGECLTRRDQQNEILNLLVEIQRATGWQTSTWIDELMIVWKRESLPSEQMELKLPLRGLENPLQTPKIHPNTYVHVRALYDYVSQDQNELIFKKDDLLQVWGRLEDSGWWEGPIRVEIDE